MMNELLVIFWILATIALAYLLIYPKFVGNNVRLMVWLDVPVTALPLGISALMYWESDPVFNFFFIEMNWFVYTLITMLILELPIFLWYLKARGLGAEYRRVAFGLGPKGSPDAGWASASAKSVEKQLNDTRWDGLRSIGAKRFLFWGSNIAILFGTGFLSTVGDNAWATYSLIHILLIFVFWFLLRQSVRLVADAPEEALDEMLLELRNRSYVFAYRWMTVLVFAGITALMVFTIVSDSTPESDGFNYLLTPTWPQIQAVFWLFAAYTWMLPSMAMIGMELRRSRKVGQR
jgi:hypothetical protein